MREFKNNTVRNLSFEEHEAIIKVGKILSDAFKRQIYSISINPPQYDKEDIWGIAFSFDLETIR